MQRTSPVQRADALKNDIWDLKFEISVTAPGPPLSTGVCCLLNSLMALEIVPGPTATADRDGQFGYARLLKGTDS